MITSQAASDQQSGDGTRDVLQSVQFRSTGVLLNIEPIVYSTGRVDLTITQEVSSALPNPNAAIASPIISNRNLSTQLTLDDGGTAVLGGLIQDSITRGDTGIPLLKDIPWIGSLFSVDSLSVERTELLVIITAYIIRSSEDRARFVDYLTDDINQSLADPLKLRTRLPKQP
ncbi:type II secretion system protein GspD [Iodidimonas nitroreducens]|uniref:type II secretion system protein GspD n=1 Tax=Iodidimonas nitroreducens TaxID=1236968 RepID=UPI0028D031C3|nr:type II and III secretion system protein [Iodidimonas nitroreducens]